MSNLVKVVDLKAIQNMNANTSIVFGYFFSRKGRTLTAEVIAQKVEGDLSKPKVSAAIRVLKKAGVVNEADGGWVMPALEISDLDEARQLGIGDKVHTTLTANPETVFYKGDTILYKPHPLSVEGKAKVMVAAGEVKSFHVNEEGFVYLIVLKGQTFDADGKPLKRKACAVKASMAQLFSNEIPAKAVECVTYKKAAGLVKPELVEMPDVSKGDFVIFFTNIHSPKAKEFGQILEGMKKGMKSTFVEINTDHQVSICKHYNIRTAPTVLIIKDGKEVQRITDKIEKVIK